MLDSPSSLQGKSDLSLQPSPPSSCAHPPAWVCSLQQREGEERARDTITHGFDPPGASRSLFPGPCHVPSTRLSVCERVSCSTHALLALPAIPAPSAAPARGRGLVSEGLSREQSSDRQRGDGIGGPGPHRCQQQVKGGVVQTPPAETFLKQLLEGGPSSLAEIKPQSMLKQSTCVPHL